MKKIFTLALATLMAGNMMAQMHGVLNFAGASTANVLNQNVENPSDTVKFEMVNAASGNITLPNITNDNFVISSFTIANVAFTMGANHVVTMPDQTFATKVTVGGEEKNITGSSLKGTYDMADNSLTLNLTFKYGAMPFDMTYSIKAYYIKPVASAITVNVRAQVYRQQRAKSGCGNFHLHSRQHRDGQPHTRNLYSERFDLRRGEGWILPRLQE